MSLQMDDRPINSLFDQHQFRQFVSFNNDNKSRSSSECFRCGDFKQFNECQYKWHLSKRSMARQRDKSTSDFFY